MVALALGFQAAAARAHDQLPAPTEMVKLVQFAGEPEMVPFHLSISEPAEGVRVFRWREVPMETQRSSSAHPGPLIRMCASGCDRVAGAGSPFCDRCAPHVPPFQRGELRKAPAGSARYRRALREAKRIVADARRREAAREGWRP